jgi:hypothetical protein
MNPLTSAPRLMVALFGLIAIVEFMQVFLFGSLPHALLFPVLASSLMLCALYRKRWAAITIKWLFYVLPVLLLLSLGAERSMSVFLVGRRIASAILYFIVARYLGTSTEIATFYGVNKSADNSNPKETSTIEKFKKQSKYRFISSVLAMVFFLPAMAIKYSNGFPNALQTESQVVALILQGISIVFLIFAYKYTKCPVCSKYPGNGWSIKSCRNCGEKLA